MLTEAILAAATHHAELTSALEALNRDAPTELEELQSHILRLEKDILASKYEWLRLTARNPKTEVNRQRGASLVNSTGKRLVYTVTGRRKTFDEKVHQEEENASKTLREELNAKEKVDQQQLFLIDCYTSRSRLEKEVQQINSLTGQLDDLYNSIFAGPTNEYPEEDAYEEQVQSAFTTLTDLNGQLRNEMRALECLEAAKSKMSILRDLYDQWLVDFATGGDPNLRRTTTEAAERTLREAQRLVVQAQSAQPDIQPILPISLNEAFDTPDQVETADLVVRDALDQLKNQIIVEKGWISSLQSVLERAKRELQEARDDLRRARRAIFEHTVSQGEGSQGGDLPPPKYEE